MIQSYDIIIVGGGSAGCVLANRLSARSGTRVLLLEAGRDTAPGAEPADVRSVYPFSYFNKAYNWPDLEVHWKTATTSTASKIPQGRILGGGSSIMGMVALRGTPEDYDDWHLQGAKGWDWAGVLPYFKKLETDHDFAGNLHGKDGPVPIRRPRAADLPPVAKALLAYCRNRDIPEMADLNAEFGEGFGILPISRFADKRASSAICYLGTDVRARPNLTIITDSEVKSLSIDKASGQRRITGVTAMVRGQLQSFEAGQVIVSAGALQSPALLLGAGIGPAEGLRRAGVEVLAARDGVGGNLHNHHLLYLVFHLRPQARAAKGVRGHTTSMVRYSSNLAGCPGKDMYIPFVANTGWHALGQRLSSLTPTVAKPLSRGRVSLVGGNGGPRPLIEFNYHADERDLVRHMDAVRRAAEMLLSPELRPLWRAAVPLARTARAARFSGMTRVNALKAGAVAAVLDLIPAASRPVLGALSNPGVDVFRLVADDEALADFVRTSVSGPGHHGGTCRMGAADDPDAVVDPQGRVYGVENLRVVDASIMPFIPRGNTNIPTLMLAEKIADAMA